MKQEESDDNTSKVKIHVFKQSMCRKQRGENLLVGVFGGGASPPDTHIELVQRRGGGVEESQEGILGILVLDTYTHEERNTKRLSRWSEAIKGRLEPSGHRTFSQQVL